MNLRGIDFGHVFCASGARNFDGNGWPFHKALKAFGLLNFAGSGLVTKTTTLDPRVGNMPLMPDGLTPWELKPKCIVVKPLQGVVLNSVGLSGPGAHSLLAQGFWQSQTRPFFISFMSATGTPVLRQRELHEFAELLRAALPEFKAPVGLQINVSCPNTGHAVGPMIDEIVSYLGIAGSLGIPIVIKLNALTPISALFGFMNHPACDAIDCSNSITFGQCPKRINWKGLFGSDRSPLAHLGGGGLSGAPLLPIVCDWIKEARAAGWTKPIVGCGGILSKADADAMLKAGATALEIGSCVILRPWRVQGIIHHVNHHLGGK